MRMHRRSNPVMGQIRTARGQIAMEYLTTYSWALFAVFIVVAVLLGTGTFNPFRYVNEECQFGPQVACDSFYAKYLSPGQSQVGWRITNGMGYGAYVTSCTVRIEKNAPVDCLSIWGGPYWAQGDARFIPMNEVSSGGARAGDNVHAYVNINYTACGMRNDNQCHDDLTSLDRHRLTGKMQMQLR